jgi:hypothetical protein
MEFKHPASNLTEDMPLVYTAMSKHLAYYRMHISKYVLEQKCVPLNPFMIFQYFLLDTVDRDLVRQGNNNIAMKADEIWVFGPVSDGMLAEINIAKEKGKPIKYFKIENANNIIPISKDEIEMEENVKEFKDQL